MQDKLEKVREFIQANPGKSNRWYADNNGLLKRATFYKYLNDILMDRSMDRSMDNPTDKTDKTDNPTDKTDKTDKTDNPTDTSEIIQNLFEEHEKNETRKLKNRQYNYNTRRRETLVEELQKEKDELQKEKDELKKKYEELQRKYEQLQTDLIFERQLKEKYENQIHDLPYKQSEFNELKKKYEKLQLDYFALKNGKEVKKDESKEKSKEQKSHNWWEEI